MSVSPPAGSLAAESQPFTVALIGDPNAGKNTLFSALGGVHAGIKSFGVCMVVLAACGAASAAFAQGLSPDEAAKRMVVPGGFEVSVVAAEPLVKQPVCIEFDDRGRLWVIQYLQYPNPEGLKRVTVDRFSRTKYDRVPDPPPKGPRGADRITILEDTDGDGRMDRGRDFVNGLNLATGLAFGHGGVFVLNVPYLLFYPDKNRDDVPDADPEVLLTGFGMEDAHSVANSLMFGPDGWLYGCQGSTVTANIRGIEFQQGVWRYHPVSKEFELFCEGGGNSWGLDFDRTGRLLYSTNWGGHVLLHGVQGAYLIKSFGKHGALHNPHAYGYFEHAPHAGFRGGHVTVGGIVYQGDAFPESFRGKYIAGDLLGHGLYWHDIKPHGSTVRTAHGGELIVANDPWFAPTDVTMGPDGAVYVSDWHDARTAHPDPDADWDRTNGRIYRVAPRGTKRAESIDFAKLPVDELKKLHGHKSQWFVRNARKELVRRFGGERLLDPTYRDTTAPLKNGFRETALTRTERTHADENAALEALWSLHALGGFDEALALRLIESPHAAVRGWAVRLLGDGHMLSMEAAHRLDDFAETEPSVDVRQQIACSAARFPAHQAMPMINANVNRDIDSGDPYLPLLWWWAVEKHSISGREEVLKRFVRPTLWKSTLGRDVLLPRLIRRYAAERTPEGLDSMSRLLKAAPTEVARAALWPPVLLGWNEQPREPDAAKQATWLDTARKHAFSQTLLADWKAASGSASTNTTLLQLAIALRHTEPVAAATRDAFNPQTDAARRAQLLDMLAPLADPSLVERSLALVESTEPDAVRNAALQILARFDDSKITTRLIALHKQAPSSGLNATVRDVLLSRPASTRAWLEAVDRGDLKPDATPLEQIRRVALHDDKTLNALVTKHWGKLDGGTREDKLAEVRRLNNDLRAAGGDAAAGKDLFKKHCAACHQMFGEGTKIGPDLTTANRQDRNFLLISLVDPSSVIRKEFVSLVVQTTGGRVVTGLPVERTDAGLTLTTFVENKIVKQTISNGDIEELNESPVSMMPENLYRQLKPQELRDLFAWLQRK